MWCIWIRHAYVDDCDCHFLVKHPAGMLFIMINLKVVNTLIDEKHQITALAIVATLKI